MNLIYKLRVVVAVLFATMLTVACDNSSDEGVASLGEAFTLSVIGDTQIDLSVDVTVTNDAVENYVVGILTKVSYTNTYSSDATTAANGIIELISDKVSNYSTVDNKYIFNGDQTANLAIAWSLEQGTSYVIFAFGINSNGEVTTDVTMASVSTSRESMYSDLTSILYINEIDPNEDWVEIYNSGREVLSLDGYILCNSDGKDDEDAVTLPAGTSIAIGGYIVVELNISANGDYITLYDEDIKIVDYISTPIIGLTSTYGRSNDASDTWEEFKSTESTKGSANGMLDTNGEEPFEIELQYTTDNRIIIKVIPHDNVGNYTYGCYPTYTINHTDGYQGDIEWFMDDICDYQRGFGFPIEEVDNLVVFNGNSYISCSDQWTIWTVDGYPDHTVAVCGIDEDGYRNTPPVYIEVAAEGVYEMGVDASYDKWLGSWTFKSTTSNGSTPSPITFDITIEDNIRSMDYYMTGFDISVLREDPQKVFYNASDATLYIDPQTTCMYASASDPDNFFNCAGKFLYAAIDAQTQDSGPVAVKGDYIAMTGTLSDSENGTLVGNSYYDSSNGTTYVISCATVLFYKYSEDSYVVFNSASNYNDSTYPIGPYTITKNASSASTSALVWSRFRHSTTHL